MGPGQGAGRHARATARESIGMLHSASALRIQNRNKTLNVNLTNAQAHDTRARVGVPPAGHTVHTRARRGPTARRAAPAPRRHARRIAAPAPPRRLAQPAPALPCLARARATFAAGLPCPPRHPGGERAGRRAARLNKGAGHSQPERRRLLGGRIRRRRCRSRCAAPPQPRMPADAANAALAAAAAAAASHRRHRRSPAAGARPARERPPIRPTTRHHRRSERAATAHARGAHAAREAGTAHRLNGTYGRNCYVTCWYAVRRTHVTAGLAKRPAHARPPHDPRESRAFQCAAESGAVDTSLQRPALARTPPARHTHSNASASGCMRPLL